MNRRNFLGKIIKILGIISVSNLIDIQGKSGHSAQPKISSDWETVIEKVKDGSILIHDGLNGYYYLDNELILPRYPMPNVFLYRYVYHDGEKYVFSKEEGQEVFGLMRLVLYEPPQLS